MSTIDDAKKLWGTAYSYRYRIRGLAAAELAVVLFYLSVSGHVWRWLAELGLKPGAQRLASLGVLAAAMMGVLLWWGFVRRLPRFSGSKPGVLFAVPGASDENTEVRHVLDQLRRRLRTHDVQTKMVAPLHAPATPTQAHALRERSRATVVVWGDVDVGTVKGRTATVLKNVSFSYSLRDLTPESFQLLGHSINLSVHGRRFHVRHDEQVVDRDVVSRNLDLSSRYIAGISLMTTGNHQQALPLLRGVQREVAALPAQDPVTRDFKITVRRVVSTALCQAARRLGLGAFPDPSTQDEVKALLEEADRIDRDNLLPQLALGIVHFWDHNLDGAEKAIFAARARSRGRNPMPYFSLAFLAFYRGRLKKGRRWLRKAIKLSEALPADVLFNILTFYDDVLGREPDRIQLLFPLGIINMELLDPVVARDALERYCTSLAMPLIPPTDEQRELLEIARQRLVLVNRLVRKQANGS